jgi:cell division septation protein DedD
MAGRQPLPAAPHGKAKSIDTLLAESESRPVAPARKTPPIVRPAPDHGDGPVVVQIGAFSSERLADQEWSRAASVAPGSMAGKGKRVVAVPTDNGTLYRTSITGFSSREKALALCDQLKAAGGRCFVH